MTNKIDAVVTALRTVLQDAEAGLLGSYCNANVVNRWIAQLPGAWYGRYRRLRLPDYKSASRLEIITHVRATLAFLEICAAAHTMRDNWSSLLKLRASRFGEIDRRTQFEKQSDKQVSPSKDDSVLSRRSTKWLN